MGFRARVVNRERPLGRDRRRHWDGRPRRAQGGLTMLRREGKPLRAHEGHIADAKKSEDELEVRLAELDCGARPVYPSARHRDDDLFAAREPLVAAFGVAEGPAGDADAVDPGLQLRGNTEVIER